MFTSTGLPVRPGADSPLCPPPPLHPGGLGLYVTEYVSSSAALRLPLVRSVTGLIVPSCLMGGGMAPLLCGYPCNFLMRKPSEVLNAVDCCRNALVNVHSTLKLPSLLFRQGSLWKDTMRRIIVYSVYGGLTSAVNCRPAPLPLPRELQVVRLW